MPLIEELPLSTPSRAQPGWAYVPEVNAQAAAAAAAAQTTSRKRNRGVDTLGSQSAKQQKAIEQRLKDLEKDNYKDARKTSGNIKTEQSEDVSMTGVPASPSTTTAKSPAGQAPATGAETATTTAAAPAAYPPQWDNDPLLRTLSLPARPSERVIQKLLAEPPLSWNEARAKPFVPTRYEYTVQFISEGDDDDDGLRSPQRPQTPASPLLIYAVPWQAADLHAQCRGSLLMSKTCAQAEHVDAMDGL
ncbi:hypothetical protein DV738_g1747, partial [Chaetothyriales sp. CBS 135597]